MKTIAFTVTNDITYDQRMHRICTTLTSAGYKVILTGRRLPGSIALKKEPYKQRRLSCIFTKGKLMYADFNMRLFFTLLFTAADCYCAIDLDTILPVYFASIIKGKKRVYDAHELFTEQQEIITRPAVYKLWLAIEKFAVPKFTRGYTVNGFIAAAFNKKYNVNYSIVRNLPNRSNALPVADSRSPFIIYQGAVNEGRCFETLIPAMHLVNAKLIICGNGNFFTQVKQLVQQHALEHKVELRGMIRPEELRLLTPRATAAVMLFDPTGLNQYQSLANRFFDYIMAGVPQVCVDYPQYRAINDQYEIAVLIPDTNSETIALALNNLLNNRVYHAKLQRNCLLAREELNWQKEEKVLVQFYTGMFPDKSLRKEL